MPLYTPATSSGSSPTTNELGTTTPGGSSEGRSASTFWAKQVTPSTTKPIHAIAGHINGDAAHVFGPMCAIFNDNAGSVGDLLAYTGMPAALYGAVASTTYRWLHVPTFYVPAAGTAIWIVFGVIINGSTTVNIHYTGSGTDRVVTAASSFSDGGWGASSGNDYSIKAIQFG